MEDFNKDDQLSRYAMDSPGDVLLYLFTFICFRY